MLCSPRSVEPFVIVACMSACRRFELARGRRYSLCGESCARGRPPASWGPGLSRRPRIRPLMALIAFALGGGGGVAGNLGASHVFFFFFFFSPLEFSPRREPAAAV